MLGGTDAASIETITFDVEPNKLDLIVGATLQNLSTVTETALIYFVQESSCSIQWAFHLSESEKGLTNVAFDPTLPTRIYGIIASDGLEGGPK